MRDTRKKYIYRLPCISTRIYQTTAKINHEKKKEAAKLNSVQDQGRSIIEVKKSFRYLDINFQVPRYIILSGT